MQHLRPHLASFGKLGLALLLMLALLPSLSRALAASQAAGPWAELCSASGSRYVAGSAGRDGQPSGATHREHCPLCGHHAGGAAVLPTAPPPALPVLDAAGYTPALFAQSPRPLFAWHAAQPRGPPTRG